LASSSRLTDFFLDHQREPRGVGEQPDGDLRLQPAFLGEPGLAESVALVGLEVQRGHVEQHQRRRPQRRVLRARSGQPLPPGVLGVDRQTALERGIGGRVDADLGQHPQTVQLAGRLEDPRQHQMAEHHVTTIGIAEPQGVVGPAQGVPQLLGPGGHDRQPTPGTGCGQTEVELALPLREPLPRSRALSPSSSSSS
jgi:hypothetical protein